MFFLPEIPGRFRVGATTFVTPVRAARSVGSAKLRGSNSKVSEPALYLEEVAFTAYYPADINGRQKTQKGLDWVIRPVRESLHGFASFTALPRWVLWPVLYLFGVLVKIPVYPNAALLQPITAKPIESQESSALDQWPLVIFSHGLGGSRTAYSQFCSRLAASGKVVLAIEHRDGTGHACMSRSWQSNGKSKPRPILYYKDGDVIWDDTNKSENPTPLPLRTEQLEFRQQELYIAYRTFCRFLETDPSLELETIDNAKINSESWSFSDPVSGKKPVLYMENVTLAGHSFGGCTVLSMLSTKPPPEYKNIPVNKALILDPWLEPLPSPGPAPLQSDSSSITDSVTFSLDRTIVNKESVLASDRDGQLPRVLVLNSEVFTLWKDHYSRLQDVISAWEPQGKRIMTLVGCQHASFSDFPGLPLIRKQSAKTLMEVITKLSIGFLDETLEQALESVRTRKMEIEIVGKRKDGRPKRKLVGSVGDVIVA